MNLWPCTLILALALMAFCPSSSAMNEDWDARIDKVDAPKKLQMGKTARVTVTVTNEGTFDWTKVSPQLASTIVDGPRGRVVNNDIAPTIDNRNAKHSGETWTFQYDITGPDTPGTYRIVWQMAHAGHRFGRASSASEIEVYGVEKSAIIDRDIKFTPNPVEVGKSFRFKVDVKDSGDVPFSAFEPDLKTSVTPSGTLTNCLKQSFSTSNAKANGKVWTFEETMQAPKTDGAYSIMFKMFDGSASFGNSQKCTLNVIKHK